MLGVLNRQRRGPLRDHMLWRLRLPFGLDHPIELGIHLYLPLTVMGVSCLLAVLALPQLFPAWDTATYWTVGAVVAVLDCLAGLVHELGHAVVATARGRRVYAITLYGLAAAARRASSPPATKEQLEIALAGPVGQLLIASVLLMVWRLAPADNEALRVAAGLPALSNLLMGAANLIPIKPLDGGRVATVLVAARAQVGSPLTGAIIWRKRSES